MSNSYPIIFSFDDAVVGDGFIATVRSQGRALLSEEEGGFWVYGVTPGGLAAGEAERSGALAEFKRAYLAVLLDLAREAETASHFQDLVKTFFHESCDSNVKEWATAVARVRAGEISLANIRKVKAEDGVPKIDVATRVKPEPEANPSRRDEFAEAA